MVDYLAGLGLWNWFILGAILLALEVMVPGTFMLWLGLSAITVGLISLAVVWSWQAQVMAFSVLAIGSIVLWRWLSPKSADEAPPQPFLNRRSEGFVGRVFTLEKPIVDGAGAVRIGDTMWMVRGPDAPAGSRVKVTAAEGGTLVVAPAEG
jgi:membrane protein implicated in regulation of membrane protease activity